MTTVSTCIPLFHNENDDLRFIRSSLRNLFNTSNNFFAAPNSDGQQIFVIKYDSRTGIASWQEKGKFEDLDHVYKIYQIKSQNNFECLCIYNSKAVDSAMPIDKIIAVTEEALRASITFMPKTPLNKKVEFRILEEDKENHLEAVLKRAFIPFNISDKVFPSKDQSALDDSYTEKYRKDSAQYKLQVHEMEIQFNMVKLQKQLQRTL